MKKVVKYLSLIICAFVISINYVRAASYDVTVTSKTVTVGNSVTLTIKGNDLAGRFDLSSSNSSVANLSNNSLFIDNNSASITITTKSVGTATITITPTDVTAYDNNTITGNKTITIIVEDKPTSNPSTGGNNSGATTNTTPTKKKSTNNYLSSLTIEGYTLDKEFKKDETEYSIMVENDVNKIKINAQLDESSATVTGIGEVEVKEEINKLEIKVTAEDGSTRIYIINVTVKELDPIEVTINKKKYTVIRKEGVIENIPENYEKSSIKIGEEEVLCYINKNTKNIIVGLTDEKGVSKFYSYDEKTKKYTLYNGYKIGGLYLNIISMPKDKIPSGYSKVSFNYDDNKLEGYQPVNNNVTYAADNSVKGSDFYLVYAINEVTGEAGTYMYDKLDGTIQRFNSSLILTYKEKADNYLLYFLLSLVVLATTIITFVIILMKKKKHKNKFA